jgi:hypothetical protein
MIMRAAASKGPADLALAHPEHGLALVQVGTSSKSLGPADRERFVNAADLCSALPVLATVTRGVITYQLVTLDTPRHWETFNPKETP